MADVVILGVGITGLSVAYFLRLSGVQAKIAEKEDTYGGLCTSFEIEGFIFDTFAHISFDNEATTYAG